MRHPIRVPVEVHLRPPLERGREALGDELEEIADRPVARPSHEAEGEPRPSRPGGGAERAAPAILDGDEGWPAVIRVSVGPPHDVVAEHPRVPAAQAVGAPGGHHRGGRPVRGRFGARPRVPTRIVLHQGARIIG
jgi:hypothetical protein